MKKGAAVKIEYIPIGEINEYANNPRDNEKAVESVINSIREFGIRVPAIIDKDNVIIAGHTRIKAAIQLGYTEFPCVRAADLTTIEAKALRLADNRMQEDSEWDTEALAAEFDALRKNGYDLLNTGFNEFEIDGIEFDLSTPQEEDPATEVGKEEGLDDVDGGDTDLDDGEFVCIICCQTDEEQDLIKQILGETGELKKHYTVDEIKALTEPEGQDSE